ncbi:hypothetical protein ANANG_G00154420, partial [Anguilla anguilla]
QHSDLRAGKHSVKWRTAVGGGSPLGPVGSTTRAAGEERAGYGSLPLSELAPDPTRTHTALGRALMLRCKSRLPSATTCRNFGMFLGRKVALAAGRRSHSVDSERRAETEDHRAPPGPPQPSLHRRRSPGAAPRALTAQRSPSAPPPPPPMANPRVGAGPRRKSSGPGEAPRVRGQEERPPPGVGRATEPGGGRGQDGAQGPGRGPARRRRAGRRRGGRPWGPCSSSSRRRAGPSFPGAQSGPRLRHLQSQAPALRQTQVAAQSGGGGRRRREEGGPGPRGAAAEEGPPFGGAAQSGGRCRRRRRRCCRQSGLRLLGCPAPHRRSQAEGLQAAAG